MALRPARAACLVLTLLSAGCSQKLLPAGQVQLVTGHEKDTWTASPAPVHVTVDKLLASSGDKVSITSGKAPLTGFSLGTGAPGVYKVTARDASQVARVEGWSVDLDPAALADHTLPLFVQRSDAFARPPGLLGTDQGAAPPVAVFGDRHVLLGGAAQSTKVVLDGYDFGLWTPDTTGTAIACPSQPCHFRSLAVVGSVVLAVGDDWAVWSDLDVGEAGKAPLPDGLSSFADIAGGETITAPDGSAYIVGATRSTPPTASVLRIATDKSLTALSLVTPRAGASAAWVEGRGLVVVGGSDQGSGVEVAATDATAFQAVGYPADPTTGSGLVALDGSTVLRVGGHDPQGKAAASVALTLGCNSACAAQTRGDPVPLAPARAFHFDSGDVLVVGTDSSGMTGAIRLTGNAQSKLTLREPRKDATAVLAPTGQVAIVGGLLADGSSARSIELYLP